MPGLGNTDISNEGCKMKCPRCKGKNAYLWDEDGITRPGEQEVEVKCHDCCEDEYDAVGMITIHVSIRRGSFEAEEEPDTKKK